MRPRQWAKSVFVLAPLFFSGLATVPATAASALVAAIVFSLVSSGVYVLNDLFDIESDRLHPVKRLRPLASGQVSKQNALILLIMVLLTAAAISLGGGLPSEANLVLLVYFLMNVAYSAGLRKVPLLDVAVIAAGFVLRVLVGSISIYVEASSWIILATGLLALLMALGKRRGDLGLEGAENRESLRGYTVEFIDLSVGILAAAIIAFYALFTVSDYAADQFSSKNLHLTTFFVVLGVLRYLQVILVYGAAGSPTDIVWSDRPLQGFIGAWLVAFWLLTYL